MYWSRVKTILIFLFFALDVFLLGYIIHSDYDENAVTSDEKANTVLVLEHNNLKIDADLIPDKTVGMGIVEMDSIWTDYDKLAATVLGDKKEKISDGVYRQNNAQLEIFETGFSYTSDIKNTVKPSAETAAKLLEKLNIEVVSSDAETVNNDEVLFKQKIDENPIFETGISVKTSKSDISEVHGYWIFSDVDGGMVKKQEYVLLPVTSVLINFTRNDLYDASGDEIVKIERGYSTGSPTPDTQHKLVSVTPAYKITLKNGDYAIYDAINGELLYNMRGE